MGRYINPFTDWGFKRLFGQEFGKDLLINFLNDLFDGEFQIIVEMQNRWVPFFVNRSIYYASKAFVA